MKMKGNNNKKNNNSNKIKSTDNGMNNGVNDGKSQDVKSSLNQKDKSAAIPGSYNWDPQNLVPLEAIVDEQLYAVMEKMAEDFGMSLEEVAQLCVEVGVGHLDEEDDGVAELREKKNSSSNKSGKPGQSSKSSKSGKPGKVGDKIPGTDLTKGNKKPVKKKPKA